MKNRSPEVDAYIARSAEFAQPILTRVRELYHRTCPEIEETIKWGAPHFEYKGMVGSMAAFKQHVSLGFWKGLMLSDPEGLFTGVGSTEMSALKVKNLSELPSDGILVAYLHEAIELNEKGVKRPRSRQRTANRKLDIPDYFMAALARNQAARATFEGFSFTHRKEYVEWVTEAKRDSTRAKRLATAIEWMAEGKPRNWKYRKGRD